LRNTARLHKLSDLNGEAARSERRGLTLVLIAGRSGKPITLHLGRLAVAGAAALLLLVGGVLYALYQQNAALQNQLQQGAASHQLVQERERGLNSVVETQQRQLATAGGTLEAEQRKLAALKEQISSLEGQLNQLRVMSKQLGDLLQGGPSSDPQGGQINPTAPAPTPPSATPQSFQPAYTLAQAGYSKVEAAPLDDLASNYRQEANSYQVWLASLSNEAEQTSQQLSDMMVFSVDMLAGQQSEAAVAEADATLRQEAEARAQAEQVKAQARAIEKARKDENDAAAADLARQYALDNTPHGFPSAGEVSSYFGWRRSPWDSSKVGFHPGVDIVVDTGTPVYATGNGVVIYAAWDDSYGRVVRVYHPSGYTSLYAHNSRLLVKRGDLVERGDLLARSGSTGMSTGPHIHYGVYNGDHVALNPMRFRR